MTLPLGGQACVETVNIQQDGDNQLSRNRLAIVPFFNFTCNGTIFGIMARVFRNNNPVRNDYPYFQVWRPSSTNSMVYTNIGEVQLQDNYVSQCNSRNYCNVNIVLTGNDTIKFQSGDVVGYYHPNLTRYRVTTIHRENYLQYRFHLMSAPSSVDLSNANNANNIGATENDEQLQPLIQFMIRNGGG